MVRRFHVAAHQVTFFCEDRTAVLTVTGAISAPELIGIVEKYYGLVGHRNILWDLTEADLSAVRDEHFVDIAAVAASRLPPDENRKTAYAAGDMVKYARLCKYMNTAFKARVPTEYAVFMDRQRATAWLQGS